MECVRKLWMSNHAISNNCWVGGVWLCLMLGSLMLTMTAFYARESYAYHDCFHQVLILVQEIIHLAFGVYLCLCHHTCDIYVIPGSLSLSLYLQ
jgi:hypothetical protein